MEDPNTTSQKIILKNNGNKLNFTIFKFCTFWFEFMSALLARMWGPKWTPKWQYWWRCSKEGDSDRGHKQIAAGSSEPKHSISQESLSACLPEKHLYYSRKLLTDRTSPNLPKGHHLWYGCRYGSVFTSNQPVHWLYTVTHSDPLCRNSLCSLTPSKPFIPRTGV